MGNRLAIGVKDVMPLERYDLNTHCYSFRVVGETDTAHTDQIKKADLKERKNRQDTALKNFRCSL